MKIFKRPTTILVFPVILCFCATLVFADEPDVTIIEPMHKSVKWEPIYKGVSASKNATKTPRLQKIYILRIDLNEKGVSFFTTPRRADEFESGKNETVRQRTNEFLEQYKLQAAINANFFAVPKGEAYATPGSSDLYGAAVSDGTIVSENSSAHPVFGIKKDGTPILAKLNSNDELNEMNICVAGNVIILEEGKIVPHDNKAVHPRTAVGISKDKRFVYLLVIDGRQKDHSIGATYDETAQWLQFYGAWNGLNLDGGGSTTMAVQDDKGKTRIINRQSDRNPRYNGNSIGVRALPLSQTP